MRRSPMPSRKKPMNRVRQLRRPPGCKKIKRKPGPRKRSRIKPMSKEKRGWVKAYQAEKAKCHEFQFCAMCGHGDHKAHMSPHHPMGKIGERILAFLWLCSYRGRMCHDAIHDNGKQGRLEGWLQPEFDGRPLLGERIIPWRPLAEAHWPQHLKLCPP